MYGAQRRGCVSGVQYLSIQAYSLLKSRLGADIRESWGSWENLAATPSVGRFYPAQKYNNRWAKYENPTVFTFPPIVVVRAIAIAQKRVYRAALMQRPRST